MFYLQKYKYSKEVIAKMRNRMMGNISINQGFIIKSIILMIYPPIHKMYNF